MALTRSKKGFVACGCATLLPLGGQNNGRQPAELAPLVRLQAPLGLASLTRPRTPPLDSPRRKKHIFAPNDTKMHFFALGQYRIILSADTASEVRQMLSQKRR